MFLSSPTPAELQMLDLPVLMEMLTHQTADYIQLIKDEGFTSRTFAARELLHNIQASIESKMISEKVNIEKSDFIPTDGNIIPSTGIGKIT
jgi:hypothetical protein